MRDSDQLKQEVDAASLKYELEHNGYISLKDYFGNKPHTDEQADNAVLLLASVNALLAEYISHGGTLHKDPDTGTHISGAKDGHGDGGFRLPDATTGKPGSAHKSAMAVDVYDEGNLLDEWITRDILIKYGLFREAKQWTEGWCHLQTREPKSGNRSFNP